MNSRIWLTVMQKAPADIRLEHLNRLLLRGNKRILGLELAGEQRYLALGVVELDA
jgi:hypothetical protein